MRETYQCEICGTEIFVTDDRAEIDWSDDEPPHTEWHHVGKTGHLPKTPALIWCGYCEAVYFHTGKTDNPRCKHCNREVERMNDVNLNREFVTKQIFGEVGGGR